MDYIKSKNIVCFSRQELFSLFEVAKKIELVKEMSDQNLTFDDLKGDFGKMKTIADKIGQRTAEDRDEHEVFGATFELADYYGKDSNVCFEMRRGFDHNKDKIKTLKDLNKFRSDSLSDCIILSKDEFRYFQMKRYRGNLNTQEIFSFIVAKIHHYANNLGDINLLIILQSSDRDVSPIDFSKIHKMLKQLSLNSDGWIMIFYNENNKFSVINTVYPILGTTRIPWQSASSKLNSLKTA